MNPEGSIGSMNVEWIPTSPECSINSVYLETKSSVVSIPNPEFKLMNSLAAKAFGFGILYVFLPYLLPILGGLLNALSLVSAV